MIFKPVKLGRDGLTEQELQTGRRAGISDPAAWEKRRCT